MKEFVSIQKVSMNYYTMTEETLALDNINFSIEKGKFVSILGPSGCGKSTLLSLIAGLLQPTQGEIQIDNVIVNKPTDKVGYMLQRDYLFEWRNILKNITLGLEIQHKIDREALGYCRELLQKYGLGEFESYYPHQLSGGMRQRVALIRTLAVKPELLLLDEAFSALDYQTRLNVSDEIWKIIKEEGKTAIMVTHDISEAISMSDIVVVLTKRPASILSIHEIQREGKSPLAFRNHPMFRSYFNEIWEEINV